MMCIMGRGMLRKLNVERHKLVKVTEQMVAAIGHQITLNSRAPERPPTSRA